MLTSYSSPLRHGLRLTIACLFALLPQMPAASDALSVVTFSGTLEAFVESGKTSTIAFPFQGTGLFEKTGPGKLILTGTNTYSGGTVVSSGILQGNSNSLQGNILNNSSLIFDQAVTGAYTGQISGVGVVAKNNKGTLTLSGSNSFTNGLTLAAGGLNINNASALGTGLFTISGITTFDNTSGASLALTTNNGQNWNANFSFVGTDGLDLGTGAVTMNGTRVVKILSNNLTVGGPISATKTSFGLTKDGDGILTLTGNNSYTGATTISKGTLEIGDGGTSGSLASTSKITNNARLVFDRSDNQTIGNLISGKGSVTQQGTGSLNLTAKNTYTGGTVVMDGTLIAAEQGLGTGSLTVNGGTVEITGNLKTGALSGSGGLIENITNSDLVYTIDQKTDGAFSGIISDNSGTSVSLGSLALVKMGSGILTLNGTNAYTGGTTLQGGGINLGSANALGNGPLTIAAKSSIGNVSGTNLILTGVAQQAWNADLSYTGTYGLTVNSTIALKGTRTLEVTQSAAKLILNAPISGDKTSTGLTKSGPGTAILAANNTYQGTTTVKSGVLQLGNGGTTGSIASTKVVLSSGAVLAVDRSDSYELNSIISGAGSVVSRSTGTLTLSGKNTYSGGTILAGSRVEAGTSTAMGKGDIFLTSGTLAMLNEEPGTVTQLQVGGDFVWSSTANIELTLTKDSRNNFLMDSLNIKGELLASGTGDLEFTFNIDPSALGIGNGMLVMTVAKGFGDLTADDFVADVAPGNTISFYINGKSLYANVAISGAGGSSLADSSSALMIDSGGASAVPEPNSALLAGIGAGVLGLIRSRRRSR